MNIKVQDWTDSQDSGASSDASKAGLGRLALVAGLFTSFGAIRAELTSGAGTTAKQDIRTRAM